MPAIYTKVDGKLQVEETQDNKQSLFSKKELELRLADKQALLNSLQKEISTLQAHIDKCTELGINL